MSVEKEAYIMRRMTLARIVLAAMIAVVLSGWAGGGVIADGGGCPVDGDNCTDTCNPAGSGCECADVDCDDGDCIYTSCNTTCCSSGRCIGKTCTEA
jgi:hypothetical protein